MKKNILITLVSFVIALMVFAGGFVLGININGTRGQIGDFINFFNGSAGSPDSVSGIENLNNSALRSIEQTINYIKANAINEKSEKELADAAIEGILSSLDDRYADYFPAQEYARIIESYSGTTSGIGVVVTADEEGRILIINVIEGTPAYEKGLMAGDIISGVEGVDIKDMSLEQVVSLIKGEEGTDVNITIFRPSENKRFDYKITRQRFYVPNFYTDIIEENILYVQYSDFQENGAKKLDEKIKTVIKNNGSKTVRGIILDLRNNLGGTLDDAVQFCDLFLDSGVIVSVKGRTNNSEKYEEFKAGSGGYTDMPVVVLINGYSASAAELAAGALKDLGRALLIGEKSFGKGTVQILNELADGSGIKYTTAKYYLPSGVTIDGTGIEPDIKVELTAEDERDIQLDRAIEELKKMTEK
ncbi:MAG: S41 family peptidase [Actinobacteria bacterium]|nr:S41 family peptidase [Actinomycetota bacterium]